MHKIKIIFIVLLAVFVFTCKETTTDPQDSYKVSGYVVYENKPLEYATVSIDDIYNWTVSTDEKGYFEISAVSSGNHNLVMRTSSENLNKTSNDSLGFSERTIEISVFDDLNLDNLKLPKAVRLYNATETTGSSTKIYWSPTDDTDFREYKLYRHSSSGLDETTGTLIHVSTAINDTIYTDVELNPYENYYYRVYVMNEYGRIGGSNIINLQTENVQLISNGSFEEFENEIPSNWILVDNSFGNPNNYIILDNNYPFDGKNSLQFHHAEEVGCWEQWITQKLSYSQLVPDAKYRLTLAFMADTVIAYNNGSWGLHLMFRNQTIDLWLDVPINITSIKEWSEISYEFGLPTNIGNNDIDFSIHFCIEGIKSWWIDDVKLERIE